MNEELRGNKENVSVSDCGCTERKENGKNQNQQRRNCGCVETKERDCDCQDSKVRNERVRSLLNDCEIPKCGEINGTEMQEIYRNATVGMESVEILRPLSEDRGFKNLLLRQYRRYSMIAKEIELYATDHGVELDDPSLFAKAMMHVTTMVNTLKDKSSSKLAEIMIQGINMGIISITKIVNHLSDEGRSNEYADKMIDILQKNLEEMKLFL